MCLLHSVYRWGDFKFFFSGVQGLKTKQIFPGRTAGTIHYAGCFVQASFKYMWFSIHADLLRVKSTISGVTVDVNYMKI